MSLDGLCGVFIPGWVGAGKWHLGLLDEADVEQNALFCSMERDRPHLD